MVSRRQRIHDTRLKHGVVQSADTMHWKNISLSHIYQMGSFSLLLQRRVWRVRTLLSCVPLLTMQRD
ncbi:hypothetical protein BDV23DRAFT_156591 [Aspergillus alliaceus]|uniref:Uncharacterized protein n=1 Tax=Petromyces alliaceus TaxID=209559 RepID=A0A5N7C7G3_PETAA|nr:hypothetical protein BDV23DRAFT_156591 [Aspergillus alliaceus]